MNVFFSYPHGEHELLVDRIRVDLEMRGHDVWIDRGAIRAGEDWRERITRGILGSDRVLAFLSVHSVRQSGVCQNEIDIALAEKGESIITILLEPPDEVQPPASIAHIQFLRMDDAPHRIDEARSPAWDRWYDSKAV